MKKLIAKVKKIRATRWNKLTLGEKVAKVVMSLVKIAAIVAVVVAVAGVVAAVGLGLFIGFAVMKAVAGGFNDAANAYRPGDRYVHFR